ncbi:uncharacterized protein LOC131006321 [Salvia miltiorrhiza]|uniref:uncharacterized protein LOC130986838 n=1 Tax=Salvia miltiorrhiza TaxID=226208 RepID=UPI0025ABE7D9|nr:uncharacterized protein LOC130986838 [Salvia miltiorrhiza]XP_057789507.1 uncharacterized protein LOC131006321 [Salvia miltiorrhiza]
MANQGHPGNTYNAEQDTNQAQMRRRDLVDQPSDIHSQGQATKLLQESGAQAKDAAHTAVNMAKGAAVGAANMAQGAAEVVKNTLGMNTNTTGGSAGLRNNSHPSTKM